MRVAIRITIIISAIVLALFLANSMLSSPECSNTVQDITSWQIDDADVPVEILWQKSVVQDRNLITVSQNHVLITEQATGVLPPCAGTVVALDVLTGAEEWRYLATPWSIATGAGNTAADYLLLSCCTNIARLNADGQAIWRYYIPNLRPYFTTLYPTDEVVYFPAGSRTLQIATETGQLLETTEDGLFAAYNDYMIFQAEDHLQVVDVATGQQQTIIEVSLPISSSAKRFEDYLLLHFGTYEIYIHHIETGELLWSMDEELDAVPRIIDGRLVTYTPDDVLHFLELESGEEIGHVALETTSARMTEATHPYFPVWIDGYDDIVSLLFSDVDELATLRVEME